MSIENGLNFNPKEQAPEVQKPKEKAEQLFGHCFEITKFDEGDRIPVGGESIFSSEVNIGVTGDFENFKQFLAEAHELAGKYDLPKLKEWLGSQGTEIDEKLFATLFAFTKKFQEKYPDNPERAEARRKLYSEKGKEIKLSDIFNANTAECAEIAALAQGYLHKKVFLLIILVAMCCGIRMQNFPKSIALSSFDKEIRFTFTILQIR